MIFIEVNTLLIIKDYIAFFMSMQLNTLYSKLRV